MNFILKRKLLSDDVIIKRIEEVIRTKGFFSHHDFSDREHKDKDYYMAYGTFRNKIMQFMNDNIVKRIPSGSSVAYYTFVEKSCGYNNKSDISSSAVVPPVIKQPKTVSGFLLGIPMDQWAIDSMILVFSCKDIWKVLTRINPQRMRDDNNGGKKISVYDRMIFSHFLILDMEIKSTDLAKVTISRYKESIPLDFKGIATISCALHFTQTYIENLINPAMEKVYNDGIKDFGFSHSTLPFPPYFMEWPVIQWHFGRDSIYECSGRHFHYTWELGLEELYRVYMKKMSDGSVILREKVQQNPNKPFLDVIEEKFSMMYPAGVNRLFLDSN